MKTLPSSMKSSFKFAAISNCRLLCDPVAHAYTCEGKEKDIIIRKLC